MRRPTDVRQESAGELVPAHLIERCRNGDQDAWTKLVDSTYREVYSLCFRILRNPDDAAEATQDAYTKAWRGLRSFRGDAQLTTWLYRVAANAAISRYRSRSRRWEYEFRAEDEVLHQIPASTTTAEVAEARLELDVVDRALAHLPENYRLVIVLRDVYGLSLEELAAELGISVVAAKVRLHRARKRLRERVYGAVDAEAEE